jgi:hypothetical protein
MTHLDDVTSAGEVSATAEIVDGKLTVEDSAATDLRVSVPEHTPLSAAEPHATLFVATEGFRLEVTLDAESLDGLVDALAHAQGGDDAE